VVVWCACGFCGVGCLGFTCVGFDVGFRFKLGDGWGGVIAIDGGGDMAVVWGLWFWFTCVIWVFVCGFGVGD